MHVFPSMCHMAPVDACGRGLCPVNATCQCAAASLPTQTQLVHGKHALIYIIHSMRGCPSAPQVFPSAVNMADTYYWYTYLRQPSDRVMTDFILDQYEELYRLYCRDRGLVPPGRLLELSFRDLEEDPIAVLRRVYDAFGCAAASDAFIAVPHCSAVDSGAAGRMPAAALANATADATDACAAGRADAVGDVLLFFCCWCSCCRLCCCPRISTSLLLSTSSGKDTPTQQGHTPSWSHACRPALTHMPHTRCCPQVGRFLCAAASVPGLLLQPG